MKISIMRFVMRDEIILRTIYPLSLGLADLESFWRTVEARNLNGLDAADRLSLDFAAVGWATTSIARDRLSIWTS